MILTFYILKNHAIPFIFALLTLMGIFLLQFLMKAADMLVGKGLDGWIIFQLIVFNLAWMVVLVIPMAVLISTLMAFGAMSQNNEVTIMKSSGVSLLRMMSGPFVASIAVAVFLVYFNNRILPDANHKAKMLMYDISQKKPTLSLESGVFSQEVNNYAILVREIDQTTNSLNGVTIYDYSNPSKINIVTAKRGKIYFTPDMTKLLMDLNEGEIHEAEADGTTLYRRLEFSRHRISMNADQFSFQQSSGGTRGDRELNSADMQLRIDSLSAIRKDYVAMLTVEVNKNFFGDSLQKPIRSNRKLPANQADIQSLINSAQNAKNNILSHLVRVQMIQREINKYSVEIHKKYSIPVACMVFILLGAPLGVMTRKGGFGMAASISLFFFLIYWAFLIGGEKLADRNILTPFWGMWGANILMGFTGIVLTYKSMQETITLDFSFLQKLVPKRFRNKTEAVNETA